MASLTPRVRQINWGVRFFASSTSSVVLRQRFTTYISAQPDHLLFSATQLGGSIGEVAIKRSELQAASGDFQRSGHTPIGLSTQRQRRAAVLIRERCTDCTTRRRDGVDFPSCQHFIRTGGLQFFFTPSFKPVTPVVVAQYMWHRKTRSCWLMVWGPVLFLGAPRRPR